MEYKVKYCEVINAANENHRRSLENFGNFLGADRIIYEDLDNREKYTIDIGGRITEIRSGGKDSYVTFQVVS